MASFVDFISLGTKICKNCSIVLFDDIIFFNVYFEGYSGLFSKTACTFEP